MKIGGKILKGDYTYKISKALGVSTNENKWVCNIYLVNFTRFHLNHLFI
jgi:hypothetical protein